jgi:hypothetical protein
MAGKRLVSGSVLTNGTVTYYTASLVRARVDKCTVTNPTAGNDSVTIFLVPSGGSAGVSNVVVDAKVVAAHETYPCGNEVVGHWIEPGGTIQASSAAGSVLSLMISGVEQT